MSISTLWSSVKRYALYVVAVGAVAAGLYLGYGCGQKSRDNEVATLATQVAESEKTTEVQKGLYSTALVQMSGLNDLLTGSTSAIVELKKQLSDSQAQLLSTQQLVVTWKQAYQGAVNATQTTVVTPPSTPGQPPIERKRVDFTKSWGVIGVSGYTLTDPPEGQVTVSQLLPLHLTVAVAKDKDGKWTSYVTSDDPNLNVNVTLGGVDPGVLAPTWKERIWVTGGVDFLGSKRGSLGAAYHFDRWALGAACSTSLDANGCGLTVGYRLFQ